MIYLDNAATTLIKPPAMRASHLVYRCREQASELFRVPDPDSVVFTMNATHGLNIAVRSLAKPGTKVLISGYEHNAVTRPLKALGAGIIVASSPLFDRAACLRAFEERIKDAELVVCTMVSNVFGFILPINEIAALCKREGVSLIVDASQAAGVLPVDFEQLGAAFIAMPGHKGLLGPQGTGLLLCGEKGEPLLAGGSGSDSLLQQMPDYLPDHLEAGTHNVPGIAGLLAGMEYVSRHGVRAIMRTERELLAYAAAQLEGTPGLELFTGKADSQSGVLSLRIRGLDCDEAAQLLSERGICLRSGLHCAPLAHRSAGTLDTGTVRMSFSPFVTYPEVRAGCAAVRELCAGVR